MAALGLSLRAILLSIVGSYLNRTLVIAILLSAIGSYMERTPETYHVLLKAVGRLRLGLELT